MPTLELPNLKAYTYQKQVTPPPIASPFGTPIGATTSTSPCYTGTQPNFNLVCQQGQTLTVGISLVVKDINGVSQPVNITGNKFEYTAKTDFNLPDTDPSVIKVDWTETNTPTAGTTSLVVPSNVTATMQLVAYYYQVWMVSSVTSPSPVVTPLFSGTQTMVQPVSSRDS
jgi:hypothetical protein